MDPSHVQQIAELLPVMRRCADDVRASLPRNSVRALAPVDAALAAADQLVGGGAINAAFGLAPLIASIATTGAPKPRSLTHAINALAAFATAVDEVARGNPRSIVDDELERARDLSAMSVSRAKAPATPAAVTARIERLPPGDDVELLAIVEVITEHRMRKLAPSIFERLNIEDEKGTARTAVHTMQRMFRLQAFADLCAALLSSPRAGTRRWALHGLLGFVPSEHVAGVTALLSDDEAAIRKEAAAVLRAAAAFHPQLTTTIAEGARAALAAHPDDAALVELVARP